MNTKLKIDFHSFSQDILISSLAEIIAKHNAGLANIDLSVIEGYFKAQCVKFDYNKAITYLDEEEQELTLSIEQGKPFVTVRCIQIIGSITASEQDLLTQENLS